MRVAGRTETWSGAWSYSVILYVGKGEKYPGAATPRGQSACDMVQGIKLLGVSYCLVVYASIKEKRSREVWVTFMNQRQRPSYTAKYIYICCSVCFYRESAKRERCALYYIERE